MKNNIESSKNEYLLLFRGSGWDDGLSQEEIEKVMGRFTAWFERLTECGILKSAQPLVQAGAIISAKAGRGVTDGPFVESKEAIGGYFLLQVDTLEEAVAIAKEAPMLQYGTTVEVRPIAEDCPILERARKCAVEKQSRKQLATA
jgi:hypothetical protein